MQDQLPTRADTRPNLRRTLRELDVRTLESLHRFKRPPLFIEVHLIPEPVCWNSLDLLESFNLVTTAIG